MTGRIPDGEPMLAGKDFAVGDEYPYQEVEISVGDRVGYETGWDLIVGTVSDRAEHADGSETIAGEDLTVVPMWENPMIRDPLAADYVRRSRLLALDELWPAGAALDDALSLPNPFAEAANEPPVPQQQALPHPSHTPPMWANNPTRTRRNKYGPTRRVN